MIIKIDDIKVSQRLRELDDTKVYDLMESIQLVGLLHPIVIDSDHNLLAGNHRLEAYRILGRDTIECKVVNLSELENELVQIDENLINVFSEDSGKTFHDWEQSIKEADYYISHLTDIGNTILDPMMGSGTTGVSALGLNRDFVGIEKEKRTFDIAQARISEIR